MDVLLPHSDGEFIRNQFTLGAALQELFAERASHVERAKHIAASQVIEARDMPQNLSLRSLADAGRSEEEDGLVSIHMEAQRTAEPDTLRL